MREKVLKFDCTKGVGQRRPSFLNISAIGEKLVSKLISIKC